MHKFRQLRVTGNANGGKFKWRGSSNVTETECAKTNVCKLDFFIHYDPQTTAGDLLGEGEAASNVPRDMVLIMLHYTCGSTWHLKKMVYLLSVRHCFERVVDGLVASCVRKCQ